MFGFWGPTLRVKLWKAASIAASGLPLRNMAAHKGSRRSSLQDRRATGGGLDALLCDAWNEAVCAIRSPQLVGRNALRLLRLPQRRLREASHLIEFWRVQATVQST